MSYASPRLLHCGIILDKKQNTFLKRKSLSCKIYKTDFFNPYYFLSFIMSKNPMRTVHTYAQVFGIINIPIIGLTSAHNTTGI